MKTPQKRPEKPPRKITREYIHSLRGMFRGAGLLEELEKERKLDKEREDRKFKNLMG